MGAGLWVVSRRVREVERRDREWRRGEGRSGCCGGRDGGREGGRKGGRKGKGREGRREELGEREEFREIEEGESKGVREIGGRERSYY